MTPREKKGRRRAVIIGAGPAGLTAAYELLRQTDVEPVILESADDVGGLSRTFEHNCNRIDIGPHRFFSKSERVMRWWLDVLPLQRLEPGRETLTYHRQTATVEVGEGPDPESDSRVMLICDRRSRIYFDGHFFDYPLALSSSLLHELGATRSAAIAVSYFAARLRPIRPERNLEDFYVNRFGRALYRMFFESYTEKVWGVSCREISAEWGAQRVRGLSLSKALRHFVARLAGRRRDIEQKRTETSLVEHFLYPKLGAGQMWSEVAARVTAQGGTIHLGRRVTQIVTGDSGVSRVIATDSHGNVEEHEADFVVSTMPVAELAAALGEALPDDIRATAASLRYRDLVSVGILARRIAIADRNGAAPRDSWIYVQDAGVRVGRVQLFNNWSRAMVADPSMWWLGLEYFCDATDALWAASDEEVVRLAVAELRQLGFVDAEDVVDSVVIRTRRAYPSYFGDGYDGVSAIRAHLDAIPNLFVIGRNGMHRYNNQDHSMLTAMAAVENIAAGVTSKANLWAVNADDEYHEERS